MNETIADLMEVYRVRVTGLEGAAVTELVHCVMRPAWWFHRGGMPPTIHYQRAGEA